MGLDQYLKVRVYLSNYDSDPITERKTYDRIIRCTGIKPCEDARYICIEYTAIYWRKANAIHRWFVDNVQSGRDECQQTRVSREQLEILFNECIEVLEGTKKAEKGLPTRSGFLFGSTEYDEHYINSLQYTVDKLSEILYIRQISGDFFYQSSW